MGPPLGYTQVLAVALNRILKNAEIPVSSRILDFLVPFRLTDLTQDIVVRQFDSSAFIKAYIVGVSV